jgi:hypothetical protein
LLTLNSDLATLVIQKNPDQESRIPEYHKNHHWEAHDSPHEAVNYGLQKTHRISYNVYPYLHIGKRGEHTLKHHEPTDEKDVFKPMHQIAEALC